MPAAPQQRRRHSTTSSTWALQSHLMALEQLAAVQQEAMDLEPFPRHLQPLPHLLLGARRYSADSSAAPVLRAPHELGLLMGQQQQQQQHQQLAGWGQAGLQRAGSSGGAAPEGGAAAQGQYIGIRMFQQ